MSWSSRRTLAVAALAGLAVVGAAGAAVFRSTVAPTNSSLPTISGAATNYPLSVSYTYNSTYYSSPAMTASTSGPTLTGGTD